jgi:hypothetical protein
MDGVAATSGFAETIDFYVSFDELETPTASRHYVEQLVRLDGTHNLLAYVQVYWPSPSS